MMLEEMARQFLARVGHRTSRIGDSERYQLVPCCRRDCWVAVRKSSSQQRTQERLGKPAGDVEIDVNDMEARQKTPSLLLSWGAAFRASVPESQAASAG